MAPCYDVVRRTLVACLVSLVASAATAAAQSMYLDANSDGVHTSADVVPLTGPWTFDVWLVTDRDRDGDPAYCAETASYEFTLRGYSFALRASNGTVIFHEVTNRVDEFTQSSASLIGTNELAYGRYASVDLPTGRYRLATVSAEVAAGTPSITIEGAAGTAPVVVTSFESSCLGSAYDGILVLGVDWFDVDGLAYSGQENRAPILDPAPMTVAEGDTASQTIAATDPDGDGIALEMSAGPAYVRFSVLAQSPGRTDARVEATPGYSDSGTESAVIRASDDFLSSSASVPITVTNVNLPPTLERPLDQEVEAGTTLLVPLAMSDPDGTDLLLTVTGPPFASAGGQSVLFQPDAREPEGTHLVTARVSDGEFSAEQTFRVTVFGTKRPPVLEEIEEMVAIEGYRVTQEVRAFDPDGDHLVFTPINFLPSMTLEIVSTGPTQPEARIVLEPGEGDHGMVTASIRVSDGYLTDERSFHVTILERQVGSTFMEIVPSPRPPGIAWDRIRFGPRDGTFHAGGSPTSGAGVTFAPPTSVEQEWAVTLACFPAQRAECYSDPHYWQVSFAPPLGKLLVPGIYEQAGNAPDSTHGALRFGKPCGVLATCTTTDSWFEIEQVRYGPGGLESLWARFVRRCVVTPWGQPSDVSGEIRWHAVMPVFSDPPTRVQAHAGALNRAEILVGGTVAGVPSVTSPDLPPGAVLTPVANGRSFLEWTPELEQAGLYDIRLITTLSGAPPDTSIMTICVDIPGALTAVMDANRTEVITSNRGDAVHASSYNEHGAFHPTGSGIPVAHAAGFLLAARVNGDVRIARGGVDYVPGPMAGGSSAPFEPGFKNYAIRLGEPFGYDWEQWPRDLGAPADETGAPVVFGDATIWSVYNDATSEPQAEPARWTAPLGIEVQQTTWAEMSGTPLADVVFQRYRIRNQGSETLEDAYIAWDVEPTTGDTFGGHVVIYSRNSAGCDTTLDLGYAYSGSDWTGQNAFGIAVLQGPSVGSFGTADTLGLTAFQDSHYNTALNAYHAMQGYRPDGTPRHEYDDPSRPVTPYAYSGDPVSGSGWLYPYPFGELQLVASSGPFRLQPGEEQEVVIALIGATGGTSIEAITLLRSAARAARSSLHRFAAPSANQEPHADAGGPYSGHVQEPVAFDGTGSSDPEGGPLFFNWSFGDGGHGTGAQPFHTYGQDGTYPIRLLVSDGHLTDVDSTTAEIVTVDTAMVILQPNDAVIRLQASRPMVWMSLEPRSSAFRASDIAIGTLTLTRIEGPAMSIRPVAGKATIQDRDRDGIEELAIPFTKSDLRVLFGDLGPGSHDVAVAIRGELVPEGSFLAHATLRVEATGRKLEAVVTPNPARGPATLTFRTTRPGTARVSVYDISGRLVKVLLDDPSLPAGYHDLTLRGNTGALSSGIYFCRVEASEGTTSCRVLLLK